MLPQINFYFTHKSIDKLLIMCSYSRDPNKCDWIIMKSICNLKWSHLCLILINTGVGWFVLVFGWDLISHSSSALDKDRRLFKSIPGVICYSFLDWSLIIRSIKGAISYVWRVRLFTMPERLLGFPKHTALIFLIFLLVMSRRLCFHQQTLCNSAARSVFIQQRGEWSRYYSSTFSPGSLNKPTNLQQ